MAAPTYNCPFSATGGTTDYVMQCSEVLAANTNKSCPLYNSNDEECLLRQFYQGLVNAKHLGDAS